MDDFPKTISGHNFWLVLMLIDKLWMCLINIFWKAEEWQTNSIEVYEYWAAWKGVSEEHNLD